ncbi:hypothetical protein LEP1GSC111_0478 [Leptospira interrogans str. UT126]|nr:hypothetical protein LEP1GSC111_0478 [Leptospira interrogans str. UT126]
MGSVLGNFQIGMEFKKPGFSRAFLCVRVLSELRQDCLWGFYFTKC